MKIASVLLVGAAALMLILIPSFVSAEGQKIEKTDPEGDVATGEYDSDYKDSYDLVLLSVDWSGERISAELKVKGDIVTAYGEDKLIIYTIKLDTTFDTNGEEITITCQEDRVFVISDAGMDFLNEGSDYTIEGGSFTVEIDKKHLEGHGEILRTSASASGNDGIDLIGLEDQNDDDDDPTDDSDTTDDDTSDDDDSPGFSFYILMIAIIGTIMIFGYRKRRN